MHFMPNLVKSLLWPQNLLFSECWTLFQRVFLTDKMSQLALFKGVLASKLHLLPYLVIVWSCPLTFDSHIFRNVRHSPCIFDSNAVHALCILMNYWGLQVSKSNQFICMSFPFILEISAKMMLSSKHIVLKKSERTLDTRTTPNIMPLAHKQAEA